MAPQPEVPPAPVKAPTPEPPANSQLTEDLVSPEEAHTSDSDSWSSFATSIASDDSIRLLPKAPSNLTYLPFLELAAWRPYLVQQSSSAAFTEPPLPANTDYTTLPDTLVLDLTFGVRCTFVRQTPGTSGPYLRLSLIPEVEHRHIPAPPPPAEPETAEPKYFVVQDEGACEFLRLIEPAHLFLTNGIDHSLTFDDYDCFGSMTSYLIDWEWRQQTDYSRYWNAPALAEIGMFGDNMEVEEIYAWEVEGLLLCYALAAKPSVGGVKWWIGIGERIVLDGGDGDAAKLERVLAHNDWLNRRPKPMRNKMREGTPLGPGASKGQYIRIREEGLHGGNSTPAGTAGQ